MAGAGSARGNPWAKHAAERDGAQQEAGKRQKEGGISHNLAWQQGLDSTSLFSQALPAREPSELFGKPPMAKQTCPVGVWAAWSRSVCQGNGALATGLVPCTE